MSIDHGEVNLPLSRRYRGGLDAEIDRQLAAQHREQRREARAAAQDRKAARRAEAMRPKLTREQVDGATAVRIADVHNPSSGAWYRVVRVSAKSVTVAFDSFGNGFTPEHRYPLSRVLEVRRR